MPGVIATLRRQLAKWGTVKDLRRFFTLTLSPSDISAERLEKVMTNEPYLTMEYFTPYMEALNAEDIETAAAIAREARIQYGRRLLKAYRDHRLTEDGTLTMRRLLFRYLSYVWNKFRTALKRQFGDFSYVSFKELHRDNITPHLHLLVSRFIPVKWISAHFPKYGGGRVCWVEYIQGEDVRRVYVYISKYLGKSAQCPPELWPDRMRRIVTSRDICLRMNPEDFQHFQQYKRMVECLGAGEISESACMMGHRPEALDACEYEHCEKCPMRRAGKCKPYRPDPWRLWNAQFQGGWMQPEKPDYVDIHNQWQKAKPLNSWQRVYWRQEKKKGRGKSGYAWEWLPTGAEHTIIPEGFKLTM